MTLGKKLVCLVIAIIIAMLFLIGCKQEPSVETRTYGSIRGRVLYSNGDDYSGIIVTLDKTDGLRAITNSDGSRAIVSIISTKEDGFSHSLI